VDKSQRERERARAKRARSLAAAARMRVNGMAVAAPQRLRVVRGRAHAEANQTTGAGATASCGDQKRGSLPTSPSVEERQIVQIVGRALDGLPANQQELLVLAYFDELTQPEISEQLRLPPATVNARIGRALERLRRIVAPPAQTPPRLRLLPQIAPGV